MTTVAQPTSSKTRPPSKSVGVLHVSFYERVASALVSLVFMVGFVALLLFIIALTSRTWFTKIAVPVEIIEEAEGRGDHAIGTARDLEPPGVEELEQFEEPQVEQSLEAVTDAVSSVAASPEFAEGVAAATTGGNGLGDSRRAGPLGEGSDLIPRAERWQIQFGSGNLKTYARKLDFFKIELGVTGGGDSNVEYAFNLSKPKPDRRSGKSKDEKRLLMIWRGGELQQADAELLNNAGVKTSGRVQMQFIPAETENLLATVELAKLKGRPLKEVKKTIFGVRNKGSGFEFYVLDQRYRLVP